MQVKISKTLEGIIARAAFNTTKAGIDHSLKDFLMLEMLREEGSLAYQLLSSRLKDWELYQVRLRIEREVLGAGRRENTGAEEFYRAFTDELCAVSGAVRSVSTAHALRAIVGDRSTATSRVLEMYGITGEVVSEDIKKFAAGDDFRTEIQVHMLDFSEENKPEINHGIDGLICDCGAVVVTEDAVSAKVEKFPTGVLNQWTYHARLYAAAKYVVDQNDKRMNLIQLVSFGCGVDAITTDEVRSILHDGGRIYTQLKIDEITNLGAVRIRLRSLFAALDLL